MPRRAGAAVAGEAGCRRRRFRGLVLFLLHGFNPFDRFRFFNARENSFELADLGSGLELSPGEQVQLNAAQRLGLPQLPPDFLRRLRQHGMRQRRNDAQPFGRRVQHGRQPLAVFGLLRQRPGLLDGQVFVDGRDLLPDIFQRQEKLNRSYN